MFERKGYVRVGFPARNGIESHVEKLIETALEASAEDFEELDPTGSSTELEVRLSNRWLP
jgi:transcriptional/translational regulatory protein YebC/TACO1